ncbi:uncharacterized protein KIAA2013 homolog [Ornithorhynchus anatinus]|uniref:KIAA2013 n=1 Tax=Ornithorhynchus anatinus TaxID=9258 RepID=A0A6I8NBJ5_ORNAN|nr:uncharacterized protein KIAA2013 homolog [Ornithorhynchus anatinus]
MWLQQRLKGLPGLLSSSWARRLVASLGLALLVYWSLGGGLHLPSWGPRRGADDAASSKSTPCPSAVAWRGEALEADGRRPALAGNGFLTLDVAANRLWVRPAGAAAALPLPLPRPPLAVLRRDEGEESTSTTAVLPREGSVLRVRCLPPDAVLREDFAAHRRRPRVYLQRVRLDDPRGRPVDLRPAGPRASPEAPPEAAAGRRFVVYGARAPPLPGGRVVLAAVAAERPDGGLRAGPRAPLDRTLLGVVHVSDPLHPLDARGPAADALLRRLTDDARGEMAQLLQMPPQMLWDEHRRDWDDLFLSGVEMKKINDAHTPSSETVNMTLYYVLSCSPTPPPNSPLSPRERDRMESSPNYADHCFSGHATMHAENLWPDKLAGVAQVLQLSDLWRLTLQKRGCKALVAAGARGMMQGMVLSFGGLQFTENHLQFQADPAVLHNSYSLHGIHYNDDLINLAVLLDAEGKPFLHVSVRSHGRPVRIYACEAGCLNEPVELTSEARGHTFPVMVTQPLTPLLYISADLTHLQDLRHTLHLKAILAHEEHMAKQYPGLPFLFWFSVASLITLFHLFLFKLIYNEYCGPGAKPLFRSKEDPSV